jgi:ketosteroid isomerase-like protein
MDRKEAAALLARLHEAQNRFYDGGGDGALRELLAPNVTWTVPGRNAIAGTYLGVEEVLGYFTRRRALADSTFRLHRRDVLAGDGDQVAALTDGTATIGGRERTWSTVGLYEVRDGRIAACWLLPLDAQAFDAIWSG